MKWQDAKWIHPALLALALSLAAWFPDRIEAAEADRENTEVSAVGESLAAIVEARDFEAFIARVDAEGFADAAYGGLTFASDRVAHRFRERVRERVEVLAPYSLARVGAGNVPIRLVRAHRTPEGAQIILRMTTLDPQGLLQNFEYFVIALDADDQVIDWGFEKDYQSAAEWERVEAAASEQSGSAMATLFGVARPVSDEEMRILRTYRDALLSQQGDVAFATLGMLPEDFRATRFWALQRLRAANLINDPAMYRESQAHLAKYFGDDPSLGMLLAGHFLSIGQPRASSDAIQGFAEGFVDDAVSRSMLCTQLAGQARYAEATPHCKRAVELEATTPYFWTVLIGVATEARDAELALFGLDGLHRYQGEQLDVAAVRQRPDLYWLADAPEFEAWLKGKASETP